MQRQYSFCWSECLLCTYISMTNFPKLRVFQLWDIMSHYSVGQECIQGSALHNFLGHEGGWIQLETWLELGVQEGLMPLTGSWSWLCALIPWSLFSSSIDGHTVEATRPRTSCVFFPQSLKQCKSKFYYKIYL